MVNLARVHLRAGRKDEAERCSGTQREEPARFLRRYGDLAGRVGSHEIKQGSGQESGDRRQGIIFG